MEGGEEFGFFEAVGGGGLGEDGSGGEEIEEFAGQVGSELLDVAVFDGDPFGVGAGEADGALEVGIGVKEAGDLGFFAAHDVGWGLLFDAGEDVDLEMLAF